MERGPIPPLRSLPRFFVAGLDAEAERFELPPEEWDKVHKVLRLSTGAELAVLPNNGEVWRCRLEGRSAVVQERCALATESSRFVTIAQALPRPEKMEEIVRMGSEIGVQRFLVFPSERTLVKWDDRKREDRLRRLRVIAREACEVAFRARLPEIEFRIGLQQILQEEPDAWVLSEFEDVTLSLTQRLEADPPSATLVVGPEGGWTRREVALIADRATTLGPRVLRVDTAAVAASAIALLR